VAPPVPELLELARAVAAQAAGDEQIEAYVSRGRETSVRIFEREIESLTSAESAGLGVRVVSQGRVGFAWMAALDEASAAEAVVEARDNARFATIDEYGGIAVPDGVVPAELDLWRGDLLGTPTESKVNLAVEVERLTRAGDPRIRQVVHSDYSDTMGESAIATSTGIEATTRRTSCFVSVSAIAGDADESQTGYGYTAGRRVDDLDVAQAASDAVRRSTRLLGAKKPSSARLTVVLDRRIAAMFLGTIAATLSGEEVAKGRSLFANRLGEEVAVANFALVDDPTNPLAWGASRADAEGLACRRNSLIEGGKLLGYLYDTRAGRVASTASTGSAVRGGYRTTPGVGARAVAIESGELSQDEVIGRVDHGLFVQSVSGFHTGVNSVSGDFSVGAEGLMIRNGALAEPVREITVASTIQRMLLHIAFIGGDLEWLPGSAAGITLAIDDMSMSGS
jgi:PmbA protein